MIKILPRVVTDFVTSASSSFSLSSFSSSDSSPFGFFFLDTVGIGPLVRKGAADRRKPKMSTWLDRIFLSWSVIPFPEASNDY